MIPSQRIRKLVKAESSKRISKKAIEKLNGIVEKKARGIIKRAIRNADFAGRNTIKEKDIKEV